MTSTPDLAVAIFTQLLPGHAGGIETNLLSMVAALARLGDSGRQILIGPGGESHWLEPHLGPRQSVLPWPVIRSSPLHRPRWLPRAVWGLGKWGMRGQRFRILSRLQTMTSGVRAHQVSEGQGLTETLVGMGVQLVHFPYQRHFPTTLPSIFEPWDLQHRHLPEFFTPQEIALREEIYRTGCENAALVVTPTVWGKQDLIRQFGLPAGKIAVIRRGLWASDHQKLSPGEAVRRVKALGLPERFILYPAKTWPHKNHLRLFQALALLRDRHGLSIPLVCTGRPVEEYWPTIERALADLSLQRTVTFTGHLADEQMAALFSTAAFLVFPSLFEGLGIPVLEAMSFGLPILTSNAACLPEVAGDAALYLDPWEVDSIAEAIHRAWCSPEAMQELCTKSAEALTQFTWTGAATQFLAAYRHVSREHLSSEQRAIITAITH